MIALVVLALLAGGPHGRHPTQLANGTVQVSRGGEVIASSSVGNLELRLAPGPYRVSASIAGHACGARTVRLRRRTTVRLYCSVP